MYLHLCINLSICAVGITSTAIVERGRNVISTSRDGCAKLWDCGSQSCLATYSPEHGVVNDGALGHVAADDVTASALPQQASCKSQALVCRYYT